MSTALQELGAALAETINATQASTREGTLGYEDESTTAFYMLVPNEGARYYVTLQDATIITAVMGSPGVPIIPNYPVLVAYPIGDEPVITRPNLREAKQFAGDVPFVGVGPHTHRLGFGNPDFVESERFEPGLLAYSTLGGMNVYVYPANWSGGAWLGGDLDLTSSIPATNDRKVLAVIGIDTYDTTLSVTLGTEVNVAMPAFTKTDAAQIETGGTIIRAGAVTLTADMTTIDSTVTLLDIRPWIEPPTNDDVWNPFWLTKQITLPAGRVMHQRFVHIADGGGLIINGALELVGG